MRSFDQGPTELFFDGAWRPGVAGERMDVVDPASGEIIASVACGGPEDAIEAVAAADDAEAGWRATAPRERGEILRRSFEAMTADRDVLANLIVRESGKSWRDAVGEVAYAAEFFRWFAEEAVRAHGQLTMAPSGDKRTISILEPVGVSVLVTPWNSPAAMATCKIAPALAAGCTVVLEPASDTPLTALYVARLLRDAGVPDGVVNVVPSRSSGATVSAMLRDSRTRKVSFTGSTQVGRLLLEQGAQRVLNYSMELGGNAPFIVFDDADVDAAVEGAMVAKMHNGGESCIAANRFLVPEAVADDFSERLAATMGALRLGPGIEPETDVGPLINEPTRAELSDVVDRSVEGGAKAPTGANVPSRPGCFYEPTVLGSVDGEDPILAHELFGPVAPVTTFVDDDDVVEVANSTQMGLAAYVDSGDLARALRTAEAIEAGIVGINRGFVSDPAAPFGGIKQSGLGREGAHDGSPGVPGDQVHRRVLVTHSRSYAVG